MSQFVKTLIVDPDGLGDYSDIQSAANDPDIVNNGGVIIVEAGEYEINGSSAGKLTVEVPSNTTIIGRGNVIVRITDVYVDIAPAFRNRNYSSGGDSRITITGFKIVVEMDEPNTYTGSVIAMKNITNSKFEKLYITTGTHTQIESENSAIYFQGTNPESCQGNLIKQCVISNFDHGIHFHTYSRYNVVSLNHVSNCYQNIYCTMADGNIIQNNILARAAVHVNVNMNKSENIIVRGNQIIEANQTGIYPSGCTGGIYSGNILCLNRGSGIHPRYAAPDIPDRHAVITENICSANGTREEGGNGIHLVALAQWGISGANSCVGNRSNGIRAQIEQHLNGARASDNLVGGNVAILHGGAPGYDKPISIEDPSNSEFGNLEGSL